MTWTLVGVGTTKAGTSSGGNWTPTEPAGVQAGDLLVCAIAYRGTVSFTLPAGWSLVATQQSTGDIDSTSGIASGLLCYIVRGASAPALTWTRSGGDIAIGAIVAYRGADPVPYDTGSANTLAAVSVTLTTPGITTASANELLVAMAAAGDNNNVSNFIAATDPATGSGSGADTSTSPQTGAWLQRTQTNSAIGSDVGLGIADAVKATAGATGTIQCTEAASSRGVVIAGAFKMAVALPVGTASGTLGLTGAASGAHPVKGSVSGALAFTGAAAGTASSPAVNGTASGTVGLTGSTTATVVVAAAASGSLGLTGSAASGNTKAQLSALLDSTSSFWGDPSVIASLFQDSAETTAVTASGQPVGAMVDQVSGSGAGDALQTVSANRPVYNDSAGVQSLAFDGVSQGLSFAYNGGAGPTDGTIMMAVKSTDTQFNCFANISGTSQWMARAFSGGTAAALCQNAGTPSMWLDDVDVSSYTRDALFVALCDGAWHIIEMRNYSSATWGGVAVGDNGTGTYAMAGNAIGPIFIDNTVVSDPSSARNLAYQVLSDAIAGTSTGVTGTATSTLPVSGAASATVALAGTVAGNLGLTGTAAAVVPDFGAVAASVAVTGGGTGTVLVAGSAAGDLPMSGTAGSSFPLLVAATGDFSLSGGSSGRVALSGTSTSSLALSVASSGRVAVAAAATGVVVLTGVSSSSFLLQAGAAGDLGLTGATAAAVVVQGGATGDLLLTSTASGALSVSGSAASAFTVVGFAEAGAVSPALGSGNGDMAFSGAAQGTVAVSAQAGGVLTLSGASAGQAVVASTYAGVIDFSGTASLSVRLAGTGMGLIGFSAFAAGLVRVTAMAVSSFDVSGTAKGRPLSTLPTPKYSVHGLSILSVHQVNLSVEQSTQISRVQRRSDVSKVRRGQ